MPRYTRKYQTPDQKAEAAQKPQESLQAVAVVPTDEQMTRLEKQLRTTKAEHRLGMQRRIAALKEASVPYRWKPGQSGNPGGRPRVEAEMRRLIQENTLFGVQRLIDIWIWSENEEASIVAGRLCLERGFGPVKEPPDDEAARTRPDMSNLDMQRLRDLRSILREIAGADGNEARA